MYLLEASLWKPNKSQGGFRYKFFEITVTSQDTAFERRFSTVTDTDKGIIGTLCVLSIVIITLLKAAFFPFLPFFSTSVVGTGGNREANIVRIVGMDRLFA